MTQKYKETTNKNKIMKKKKIKVVPPLLKMEKDHEIYISRGSWEILWKGEKLMQYIKKDAKLYLHPSEETLLIKRVGDGETSGDFKIDFPEKEYYAASIEPISDENKYLPPSEIDFEIVTLANADSLIDYTSFNLSELSDIFNNCLDQVNIDIATSKIEKILKALPVVAEKEFLFFDDGILDSTEDFWKETLADDKQIKEKKRKTFAVAFDEKVLDVVEKVRKQNQSKDELERLSIDELKIRQEKASSESNFELAAQIRDLIAAKTVQKQEKK